MTRTTIIVVQCDFAGCDRQEPQPDINTMPTGWTSAIYTHGCQHHGELIQQHAATVTSIERRNKALFSLLCACGWKPQPAAVAWSARALHEQHREHLAASLPERSGNHG